MTIDFGALNWSILIIYILINVALGVTLGKGIKGADDFYLGNRNIPWFAIGLSVIATYVSALSFLGGPAWSYTSGLSVMALHLNYPLVIFIAVVFFLPFFYNSGAVSIYEYMEKRFGTKSRNVMATVFLISQTMGAAAILYATSLILEFITGIRVEYVIVMVAIVALIYTMLGGIAAVIWTDVVQAVVLVVGAGIIFYYLLAGMTMPIGEVLVELKAAGKTNALDWSFDLAHESTLWAGIIGMTLFHITVYGANQMMMQRVLTAKNIGDAKKSYLLMGFFAFFLYFLFFLLGILFYSYYQGKEFPNGNTIILEFAASIGLPGLMGIITAAVLAASLSSLDSSFNSLATISTTDFYQRYVKKDGSSQHYLLVTRLFTLFWAVLIIVPAIMYAQSEGSILQVLSKVASYFVGAKLAMYGLGFFSKHTTENGLLIGVAAGFLVIMLVALMTDISWPWYGLIGASVNVVISVSSSILLEGKQKEYSPYTVIGQKLRFANENLAEKSDGWYLVPGKVDSICYYLLLFFAATIVFLFCFNYFIG